MTTNKDVLYKETQFYIIAILTISLTFALAVLYFPITAGGTVGSLTPNSWRSRSPCTACI